MAAASIAARKAHMEGIDAAAVWFTVAAGIDAAAVWFTVAVGIPGVAQPLTARTTSTTPRNQ
jgi:hypothetical protein